MSKEKTNSKSAAAEGTGLMTSGLSVSIHSEEGTKDRWTEILRDSNIASSIEVGESQEIFPVIADLLVKKANSAEGVFEILSLFQKKPRAPRSVRLVKQLVPMLSQGIVQGTVHDLKMGNVEEEEDIATIKVQVNKNEIEEFKVKSDLRGKIEEVYVEEGDTVVVGQALFLVLRDVEQDAGSALVSKTREEPEEVKGEEEPSDVYFTRLMLHNLYRQIRQFRELEAGIKSKQVSLNGETNSKLTEMRQLIQQLEIKIANKGSAFDKMCLEHYKQEEKELEEGLTTGDENSQQGTELHTIFAQPLQNLSTQQESCIKRFEQIAKILEKEDSAEPAVTEVSKTWLRDSDSQSSAFIEEMATCGQSFLKEIHSGKQAKLLQKITLKKFGVVYWKADTNVYTMEILSFGDDAGGQVVGEGTWNFDSEVTCFVSDKASKCLVVGTRNKELLVFAWNDLKEPKQTIKNQEGTPTKLYVQDKTVLCLQENRNAIVQFQIEENDSLFERSMSLQLLYQEITHIIFGETFFLANTTDLSVEVWKLKQLGMQVFFVAEAAETITPRSSAATPGAEESKAADSKSKTILLKLLEPKNKADKIDTFLAFDQTKGTFFKFQHDGKSRTVMQNVQYVDFSPQPELQGIQKWSDPLNLTTICGKGQDSVEICVLDYKTVPIDKVTGDWDQNTFNSIKAMLEQNLKNRGVGGAELDRRYPDPTEFAFKEHLRFSQAKLLQLEENNDMTGRRYELTAEQFFSPKVMYARIDDKKEKDFFCYYIDINGEVQQIKVDRKDISNLKSKDRTLDELLSQLKFQKTHNEQMKTVQAENERLSAQLQDKNMLTQAMTASFEDQERSNNPE